MALDFKVIVGYLVKHLLFFNAVSALIVPSTGKKAKTNTVHNYLRTVYLWDFLWSL